MGTCNEKLANLDIDYYKSLLFTDEKLPLVSLEESIKPLISLLPTIETYVEMVKQKCVNPSDGLTSDESASIMLYSIIWQPLNECLYTILNSTLQTFDKTKLEPWLFYLKLLFTALLHLPSDNLIVYRGNRINLNKQYKLNDIIVWGDLSLCTISKEYFDEKDLHTIFTIKSNSVKNIHKHCYFDTDHFVVFLPVTKFQIIECVYESRDDLCLITLQEIESSFILHSENEVKSNIFTRLWSSLKKKSKTQSNNHYRNTSLEHFIIENGHSWSMDLDKQNLNDQDMQIIVKYAIIKNRCKRIRLRDNHITFQGSSILSEGLYNNTILESLDLRNNQISDKGVQVLSSAIIHSNIKTLNLESNDITSEGAVYLAQLIKDSRTLSELYLSKNHLSDRGVELIANALSDESIKTQEQQLNKRLSVVNQSTLQHLYLGQNDITDNGLKHLSDMLKTNRTLTWLWLSGNEIGNEGIEYLSHILADYNVTLEWLFVNSNKLISDSSIDDLLHMLKRNNTLKTLYINNCDLSEIAKRKLIQMTKLKKDFDLEI